MVSLLGLVVFIALVGAPASALAQTVDEIVARHIAARGGKDKLAAIQTVKMTRTVASGIGTTLKVIVYKKRPALMRIEQGPAQPGAAMTPRGINGEAVWDMAQGKVVPRPAAAGRRGARSRWRLRRAARRLAREGPRGRLRGARNTAGR